MLGPAVRPSVRNRETAPLAGGDAVRRYAAGTNAMRAPTTVFRRVGALAISDQ